MSFTLDQMALRSSLNGEAWSLSYEELARITEAEKRFCVAIMLASVMDDPQVDHEMFNAVREAWGL
jgi:hypothetical protein